ncbi:nuclear transport factor 2 family protein [Actinomycetospora sp.]|jgi:hypothetical protein|uniref:nuclear transport factor 2 family protein n=1 Tax=Actinomycetospora sp. TaxID=1872135 RepID=UPI002F42D96C
MTTGPHEFHEAVARVGRAINEFVNGDAGPYKECWSHGAQVSIFGGRGAHEVGWDQVATRLDWAASGFEGGWTEQEVLVSDCGEEFGYTVCLERGEQTVAGRAEMSPSILRVTHVFRRDGDVWGVVHRHADPVTARTSPEAILVEG